MIFYHCFLASSTFDQFILPENLAQSSGVLTHNGSFLLFDDVINSPHLSYQPTDTNRRCIFSGYSPKAATLVFSATKAWKQMETEQMFKQSFLS